ncbi:Casein kinase I like protein, partial [Termitomyces sp. J132]
EACISRYLSSHSAIPEFYAYGRQDHFKFLALELLGPSLGELWDYNNCFSLGTVFKVAAQVVRALTKFIPFSLNVFYWLSSLSYIHKLGIVHRDIKPSNVLLSLDNPDQLKIVDFGMARRIDSFESKRSDDGGYVGTLVWAGLNSHEGFRLYLAIQASRLSQLIISP